MTIPFEKLKERLLANPDALEDEAAGLRDFGARRAALGRFGIGRFARDWDDALRVVTGRARARQLAGVGAGMGDGA